MTHLRLNWHSPLEKFYRDHSTVMSQNGTLSSGGKTGAAIPVRGPQQQENSPRATSALDKAGDVTHSSGIPLRDRTNSPWQEPLRTATLIKPSDGDKLEHGVKQFPVVASPFTSSCNVPFSTDWKTISFCPPENESTSKISLSGRGCYISKFSPTGSVVALAINRREATDTRLLFFSPLVETGLSSPAYQPKVGRKLGR